MKGLILYRGKSTEQGTFGSLEGLNTPLHTLELPWRNNERHLSCIPSGNYECRLFASPRFGQVYKVNDVPGRSFILFHSGNFAGDIKKGFQTDVEGCLLLGLSRGRLQGQAAVLESRQALASFMQELAGQPFKLRILEKAN